MKRKYLKGIMALGLAVTLFFSSCLKDARQFQPESVQSNLAELPLSGMANFAADAITKAGLDTIIFAVGVTAANPPTTSTSVSLVVDNSIITSYVAANPAINYLPIPTSAYKLASATVVIPSGKNSTLTYVIVDRTQLDPTLSYMLPVKVASASGLPISANYSIHYYHIIGNDFAGPYTHDFIRTPAGGNFTGHIDIFQPDSPTQFEVVGGYYNGQIRYVVNFVKTGSGASATYSNFTIAINAADKTNILDALPAAITVPPSIVGYVPGTQYTYAQAKALFAAGFQYDVLGGSGARHNLDQYH